MIILCLPVSALQKDVRKQLYGDNDDKIFFEGLKVSQGGRAEDDWSLNPHTLIQEWLHTTPRQLSWVAIQLILHVLCLRGSLHAIASAHLMQALFALAYLALHSG
jgi:hypothetical protein